MKLKKLRSQLSILFFLAGMALLGLLAYFYHPRTLAESDPNFIVSVDKRFADPGDVLTYTLKFTNSTGQSISNFILRNRIPDNTTFVPGSYYGNPTLTDNILQWPPRSVSAGAVISTSFQVSVNTPSPRPTTTSTDVRPVIYAPTTINVNYPASFDATQSTGWNKIGENDIYGIENYSWDFGDGTPVQSDTFNSALSHTFANTGTYNVRLTVTDSRGGIGVTNQSVTVTNLPKVTASGFTSEAVNSAAAGLSGQPGIIHLPAGTYSFTTQVGLKPGQILEGEGIGRTIVQQPGSSGYAISVQGSNTAISGITFTSSTINFPRTIIFSYDSQRNVYKNLYVHNCEITHMEMGNTTPQVNTWSGAAPYKSYASAFWENNIFHLNALGGAGYSIIADRGSYFVIKNNEFYSNRHSIAGAGQTGQTADPNFYYYSYKSGYDIIGNTFHGPNADTITCPTASDQNAKCITDVAIDMHVSGRGRLRIDNNQFKQIKWGMGLHDGWGEIKNNTFDQVGSGGYIIKLDGGEHNSQFRCSAAVDAADPTLTGSEICIGANNFQISGNTFTNPATANYFKFYYPSAPTNVFINGCKVTSPTFTGKGLPGESGLQCS